MRNIFAIFKRELGAYFTRPLGYVYLLTFIVVNNLFGLFLLRGQESFFDYPVADMRMYFWVFAGVSAFFVAAVTMRIWAEEKENNTFEMLLTLPMRTRELVAGKFLACLFFYVIGLALTLTVPLMMVMQSRLGEGSLTQTGLFGQLDARVAACGYCGALLLGAAFIAFGIFVSAVCRDQVVAFVLTAPALFVAYLCGHNYVKGHLNSALQFVGDDAGTALGEFVGVFKHFDNLAKGLPGGGDLLFFAVWTIVFLLLCGIAVERRSRPGGTALFAASLLLLLGIGAACNWITQDVNLGHWDVTSDRRFTVSEVSVEVLKRLKEPVNVEYLVSPKDKMPLELEDLEQEVVDKLEALRVASGDMLHYKVIRQEPYGGFKSDDEEKDEAKNGSDKKDDLVKRIMDKIYPVSIGAASEGKASVQTVLSGMQIKYLDNESHVINPILPESMKRSSESAVAVSELEYEVIKYLHKATRAKMPKVAIFAPRPELDPQMAMLYQMRGMQPPEPPDPFPYLQPFLERENFEVERVALTKDNPLPEDYDVLVVAGPHDLNPRQQWEINRALTNGKPVFLAAQNCSYKISATREGGMVARKEAVDPGVNAILSPSGVTLESAILAGRDEDTVKLEQMISVGPMAMVGAVRLPYYLNLQSGGLLTSHPALKNVNNFLAVYASPLLLDEERLKANGITATVLVRTPKECWKATMPDYVSDADFNPPADGTLYKAYPVAALLEGQFKNALEGKPAPEWPKEKNRPDDAGGTPDRPGEISPKPGKLLLVGDADAFGKPPFATYEQISFFVNAVCTLGLDETGARIRDLQWKNFSVNKIKDFSERRKSFWKAVQMAGHAALLLALGLVVWIYRFRRREAYEAGFRKQ